MTTISCNVIETSCSSKVNIAIAFFCFIFTFGRVFISTGMIVKQKCCYFLGKGVTLYFSVYLLLWC